MDNPTFPLFRGVVWQKYCALRSSIEGVRMTFLAGPGFPWIVSALKMRR
jgi:hypothetical protein